MNFNITFKSRIIRQTGSRRRTGGSMLFHNKSTVPHSGYFLRMACLPPLVHQLQCPPTTVDFHE